MSRVGGDPQRPHVQLLGTSALAGSSRGRPPSSRGAEPACGRSLSALALHKPGFVKAFKLLKVSKHRSALPPGVRLRTGHKPRVTHGVAAVTPPLGSPEHRQAPRGERVEPAGGWPRSTPAGSLPRRPEARAQRWPLAAGGGEGLGVPPRGSGGGRLPFRGARGPGGAVVPRDRFGLSCKAAGGEEEEGRRGQAARPAVEGGRSSRSCSDGTWLGGANPPKEAALRELPKSRRPCWGCVCGVRPSPGGRTPRACSRCGWRGAAGRRPSWGRLRAREGEQAQIKI